MAVSLQGMRRAGCVQPTVAENVVEAKVDLHAVTAEGGVHPKERLIASVEAQTEAAGFFELAEIPPLRRHAPHIAEQRHVEAAEHLPAVLGIHQHHVVAAEAIRTEA